MLQNIAELVWWLFKIGKNTVSKNHLGIKWIFLRTGAGCRKVDTKLLLAHYFFLYMVFECFFMYIKNHAVHNDRHNIV